MPVHLVEVSEAEVFDVQHRFSVTRPVLPPGEILFVFGSDIKMDRHSDRSKMISMLDTERVLADGVRTCGEINQK